MGTRTRAEYVTRDTRTSAQYPRDTSTRAEYITRDKRSSAQYLSTRAEYSRIQRPIQSKLGYKDKGG